MASKSEGKLADLRDVRNELNGLHTSHHEGRVLRDSLLKIIEIFGPDDLNDDEPENPPVLTGPEVP